MIKSIHIFPRRFSRWVPAAKPPQIELSDHPVFEHVDRYGLNLDRYSNRVLFDDLRYNRIEFVLDRELNYIP